MKMLFANFGNMKVLLRAFGDDNLARDFFDYAKSTVDSEEPDKNKIRGHKLEGFLEDDEDYLVPKIQEMFFGENYVYFGCGSPDNYTLEDLVLDKSLSGWDLD